MRATFEPRRLRRHHGSMVDRWRKQASRPLHDYGFLRVRSDRYSHPDLDEDQDFLVIEARDWVNVVAETPSGDLVLIRQFRYGVGDIRWEIPAGVIEPGEAPADAAVRELREETGYTGDPPIRLCAYEPNPAYQANLCTSYLVRNARPTHDTEWDHNEVIEVLTRSPEQVLQMIDDDRIPHALLQLPLMHYLFRWRTGTRSSGPSGESL